MLKRFAHWILRNECDHTWVFFGHVDRPAPNEKKKARAIRWTCCKCKAEKLHEYTY